MKKLVIILFCLALTVSCKEEPKTIVVKEVEKIDKLKLKLDYQSSTADIMQVVFNKIEIQNDRDGNYTITEKLKASEASKELNFEMSGDYIATVVQVRFGKKPKKVKIENITVNYKDVVFKIEGSKIDQFFTFNKYIKYDAENNTIETFKVDGKHNPVMTLRKGRVKKLFII